MKTPEIVFLQWHGDCHPEDCSNDDDVDPSGASWCWEKIFPADIEYIRMDKFNEVKKQRDEWQRQAEEIITERNKLETQRDELLAAAKQAVDCIAYAIYNLADKKLEELPASIIDSTDPVYSGLIAEKVMRAAIAGAEG